MFKKTCCMLIMVILIFTNNVKSYRSEYSDESSEENIERLARIFDGVALNNNNDDESEENTFVKKGLGGEVKALKCTEIINNGYHLTVPLVDLTGVSTVEECMAQCDKNKACMSWIAYTPAKQCWLRSTAGKVTQADRFKGGLCIESTQKSKCVEVSDYGYYKGPEEPAVYAANSPRCRRLCDDSNQCMGWSYNVPMRECALISKTGEWINNPNYKGGACNEIVNSKCKEKLLNSAYAGNSRQIESINSVEDCIKQCEADKICSAWSYSTASKNCYLYTSVSDVSTNTDFTSGQCYRGDLRADQCEKKNGYPKGGSSTKMTEITTDTDCKTKCDQNMQCWGWGFELATRTCDHYSTAFGFTSDDGYVGGSCYAPATPYIDMPTLKKFQQQALNKHNEYRKKHCVPELTLSEDLNEISQDRADRLARFGKIPPNYNGFRMENLYHQSVDYQLDGAVAVNEWYKEIEQHNWSYPDFTKRNRFAKVIWNSAQQIGIGRALSRDKTIMYVVATYLPGGYIEESYKDNVKPLC